MTRRVSTLNLVAAAALAAVLAGCSSTKLDTPPPVENRDTGATTSQSTTSTTAQSTVTPVDLTKGGNADAGKLERVVYFDFDSFAIKDEYKPVIESNARALKANSGKKMVVEGHTDSRGGREYNLALGQKRAEAVVKSLELLGASDSQLEATSFGKERPAVQGENEEAWAKNRRAELRDK